MYSVVQDHPIWTSSSFWEKAFFVDVQDEIKNLYTFHTGDNNKTSTDAAAAAAAAKVFVHALLNANCNRKQQRVCAYILLFLRYTCGGGAVDVNSCSQSNDIRVLNHALRPTAILLCCGIAIFQLCSQFDPLSSMSLLHRSLLNFLLHRRSSRFHKTH